MAIKTRQTTATGVTNNNAPLTNAELDNNFVELQQNKVDASGDTMTGNLSFGDDDKAIFGAGSDLQIYHDGDNSYILDNGIGDLRVQGYQFIKINNVDGSKTSASFNVAGPVLLNHNNSQRLATSSAGVDITGEVKADKFVNDEALPDVRPSLLLDFANQKALDPRITFTRGSTATYWDGKTTTKAEENLLPYSTSFFGWSFATGVTTTSTTETAPDGTSTAITVRSSNAGNSGVYRQIDVPIGSTVSFYAKYSNSDWVAFSSAAPNNNVWAYFDVTNGAVGFSSNCTASIQSVGNGWYRCILANIQDTNNYYIISLENSNTNSDPWGTSSPTIGTEITLWGPQLEQRSSVTAYTSTNSSPIVKYQPVLQTAASGEARFDHDPATSESKGLLIEETRTNLIWPSTLDSTWGKVGQMHGAATDNYAIAPDGTYTAGLIYESTEATQQLVSKVSSSVVSGSTYVWSVFVKPYTWDGDVEIHAFGDASTSFNIGGADFNASSKGMYSVGNGWKRIWWQRTKSNTTGTFYLGFSGNSYAGAGYAKAFLAWGFQLELGSFPTSYIPTSGSTVTRAVDLAVMTGTNFSDWYTPNEGTVFADISTAVEPSSAKRNDFVQIHDNTDSNSYYFGINSVGGSGIITLFNKSFNANDVNITVSVSDKEVYRAAYAYEKDNFAFSIDGSISTDTSASILYEADRLNLGSRFGGPNALNGCLKKVAIYPQRLSNATLQAMTEE